MVVIGNIVSMSRFKYICYYSYSCRKEERRNLNSAVTKIDYIVSILNRLGYGVDIISKTPQSSERFSPSLGFVCKIGDNNYVRHFASLGCRKNKFLYILSRVINTFHFFFWLLFNTKRGEQILVYHSLGYCISLSIISKIKGVRLIGEIEEFYEDVMGGGAFTHFSEELFVNSCDSYIFPTQLLRDKVSKEKQSVVIHGVYKVEERVCFPDDDGKVHVVYGGSLSKDKGCIEAAKSVKYLPKEFFVHICGNGANNEIRRISEVINGLREEGYNNISYEGALSSVDYKLFIQKCHIGLCTQNPHAAFTSTSFPSKILIYLSNGLKVVSINIPSIRETAIASNIDFFNDQTPEAIANAIIMSSRAKPNSSIELLRSLDEEAVTDIKDLLV